MRLSQLARGVPAEVIAVQPVNQTDLIARRLQDLGFVPGESVRVLARAPLWQDPILVEIGYTRFALRRSEADRVCIQSYPEGS